MTQTILIIDDEADIRDILADIFEDEGYNVLRAAHSEQALSLIKNNEINLIVLDIWLDNSDMDGMQILKHLKSRPSVKDIPILMISGHGNVEMAVNAMKIGAFDFIEKPFKVDHIVLTVNKAIEQRQTLPVTAKPDPDINTGIPNIACKSNPMSTLIKNIREHSEIESRILIIGDQWSGRTHLAKFIHSLSRRSKYTCVEIQAKTFDIEKFKDTALHNSHGTIIVKDLQYLEPVNQVALLSLLNKEELVARIICTADHSLRQKLKDNQFSSALYDRLAILKYDMPSLNQRQADIPLLTEEFIANLCVRLNINTIVFDEDILIALCRHDWVLNIIQLKTTVEWIVIYAASQDKEIISLKDLKFLDTTTGMNAENLYYSENDNLNTKTNLSLKEAREQFETNYLSNIMFQCDGNIAQMSEIVDMERTALYRKLKSLNIQYSSGNGKTGTS
jgi:two-component system nitrogen regulation response regulator NtrX